jgi:hypothetical protein
MNNEIGQALSTAFQQFVIHTSNKYLTSIELMKSNPYIVDDFFLLSTICIKSKSTIVHSIFDNMDILSRCSVVGTAGLLQDQSDALTSVIVFFERLLTSKSSDTNVRRQNIINMLSQTGNKIIENILLGICYRAPWNNVNHGDFNLGTLLHEIGTFDINIFSSLLHNGLNILNVEYANDNDKLHFRDELMTALNRNDSRKNILNSVLEIVGRFGNLTRQNYGKYRRKQLAAKHAEMAKIR